MTKIASSLRARVERALPGERAHLARHVLVVRARRRTEHRATAHPVRRARRALTGAAGALLLPRLLVAARDVLADLRRRVALALVGEERLHRLVHHRHVDRAVERRLRAARPSRARGAERRVRGRLGVCVCCQPWLTPASGRRRSRSSGRRRRRGCRSDCARRRPSRRAGRSACAARRRSGPASSCP